MSKIDFSKAPEGATHYAVVYGNNEPDIEWIAFNGERFIECDGCVDFNEYECLIGNGIEMNRIPKQLTVTCKTKHELMLCEQVLRMCRGEGSEFKSGLDGDWKHKSGNTVNVNVNYRAKPKKELAVPWEWIADEYNSFTIRKNGAMYAYNDNDIIHQVEVCGLKLDLTDIDLPVTVERPKC